MSEDLDELFLSPIPGPTPVELQQCILFGFRRRLYPSQILEECRSAFGPFAPSAQYVAKWYQRFQDGLFAIDEHDEEWGGQTPTTCSDYNDEDNDNEYQNQIQNDSDNDTLPLVLQDVGQPSDKDSYSHDEFKDGHDDDDDDDDDEHVISYWQGYGYLGGKPTTATAITTTATTLTSSPAKINVTGSTLDAQIATLRKEMYGLRQLDLSLLSQLWALNDSIQEFRTMIEEQDDEEDDEEGELDEQGNRRHSPTPSSYDSVSSEGGAEADLVMQAKAKRLGTIPKVITTQPKQQQQQHLKLDMKPVPRMRSAPPPPPPAALMCTARKSAAPPRPT
ncbi:hypothetical protein ACLKA6_001739 [Drosophila palustris]